MDAEDHKHLKLWIIASAVILLALAVYFGLPVYRHLKEKHAAAEARAFFDKGDYRNAWLSARQTLVLNSNNVEACRVMLGLADAVHSPVTLDWCRRLVTLAPTVDNKLLLASVGMRYQNPPYPLTAQTLDDLPPSATNQPGFHLLSAQLALARHRMGEAEAQFEVACQLDPTNQRYQLNLAVIRLSSTNATVAAEARAKLERFNTDTNLGPSALRSLVADRLIHDDSVGALNFSTQLLASAQANLGDRLQHLGILKRLQSSNLAAELNSLQRQSATNAVQAAQAASWMEVNGLRSEATEWLNHLPAALQQQQPVRLALVDGYLGGENWRALRDLTVKGDWGEVDFLRLAFLSHAWDELGQPLMANADWRSAVSEAGDRFGGLTALLELAKRWQLQRDQEDLLWRILRRFPDTRWAQQDLEQFYLASGNTAGLYRLYSKLLSDSPQNVKLKNNAAFTALLLKTNVNQARQWAAEASAETTNDAAAASTYAYALHLQGRNQDGLAALQKLPASVLEQPAVALYYGVLLSAVGRSNEAAPYLKIAQTKGQLLPEEKRLLTQTMK